MTTQDAPVLIVDDDPGHREMLREVLAADGPAILTASSGEEALEILAVTEPALMLLDVRMPGMGGMAALRSLRESGHAVPVVVMTAYADVADAVEAMKLGARDYLSKPIDVAALRDLVARYLGGPQHAAAAPSLPDLPAGIAFESPLMHDLLWELERVARSDVPALLLGETGTGKEVLAQLLHKWSARARGPLVCVNLSAVPDTLLESELFGSEKGAYTGADHSRSGRIEDAAGGTLFLDEIGELPVERQPKLLRVLESGCVVRLGGGDERHVDFRLVTATNRDLERAIDAGGFRQDLYYRIAVVTIEVPPLRERPEDVLALARRFLAAGGGPSKQLTDATESCLLAHPWPGNIRELRNAMSRAAILAPGERVLPEHLPPGMRPAGRSTAVGLQPGTSLHELEKRAILAALERHDGNRSHAAKELGISRRKLLYRLKEYGGTD